MTVTPHRRSRIVRRGLVAAAAALGLALVAACGGSTADDASDPAAEELSGYTRDPAPSVAQVSLPDASGADLSFVADDGGIRVVYFGYTSCPDVCPTTMADLKRAVLSLPEADQERVSFVMVTVDPDRDVPTKLDTYVTTFLPEGLSARTEDDDQLREAATAFGADYSVVTADDGEIEVSHTAELYAVDDTGTVVLQWPFGISSDDLASDLATLLERSESA